MHVRFRYDSAFEDVTHEEVIVHRLRDDLCNSGGIELDERVVFRTPSLKREKVRRRPVCVWVNGKPFCYATIGVE